MSSPDAVGMCCAVSLMLSLGLASGVSGQDLAGQTISSPLVTAALPTPTPIDWSRYDITEECTAAFERALLPASRLQEPDTLRDTLRHDNPWIPLPAAAVQVGRQCLRRFRLADVPALALPSVLRLAVAVNADTLVQAIVTRQLMSVHDVTARAAVLDSAVNTLLSNHWNGKQSQWNFTTAHVQLARTYVAQLDALGDTVDRARIEARQQLRRPAQYANDLETELTLEREITPLLQHIAPGPFVLDEWPEGNQENILRLTYLQSMSHQDLAALVGTLHRKFTRETRSMNRPDTTTDPLLLGTPAPEVTGDYWFNTPGGTAAVVPAQGKISVIVFGKGEQVGTRIYTSLRRLHEELPDVAIIKVDQTQGVFGQQSFVGHPDQEAAFLHAYDTDSLRLPGIVCVINTKFETVQGEHIIPLVPPLLETYHAADGYGVYVVDPAGLVVYDGLKDPFMFNWIDFTTFIRRLHTKF